MGNIFILIILAEFKRDFKLINAIISMSQTVFNNEERALYLVNNENIADLNKMGS